MAQKAMPEWATEGATVYGREYNTSIRGGEATLRKGTISRVTAASIFVRFNTAAGETGAETRYTLQRWNDAPELYGNDNDRYTRILVSEEQGQHELQGIAQRRYNQTVALKARKAAEQISYRLTPTTAREAIEALQAYLENVGE